MSLISRRWNISDTCRIEAEMDQKKPISLFVIAIIVVFIGLLLLDFGYHEAVSPGTLGKASNKPLDYIDSRQKCNLLSRIYIIGTVLFVGGAAILLSLMKKER